MKTPGWMTKLARPTLLVANCPGVGFVCAGIIGLILPVIPGVPLLLGAW